MSYLKLRGDLISHYYLLAFPKLQGEPSEQQVNETLTIGIESAKDLANDIVGNKESFTMLCSGYSACEKKVGMYTLYFLAVVGAKRGCI